MQEIVDLIRILATDAKEAAKTLHKFSTKILILTR